MTRGAVVVALGAAALAALVASTVAQKHGSERPTRCLAGQEIAVAGDSLGVGLTGPLRERFKPARTRGYAEVSTTAAEWSHRVERVLADHPDTVILSLGTNDARSRELSADFLANAEAIERKCAEAGALAVWLAPPEMPFNMTPILTALDKLAMAGSCVVEPPARVERQPDRVHPTPAGYRAWAVAVARALGRP